MIDLSHGSAKISHRQKPSAGSHGAADHNQAAFVEQIARNDQERLKLERKSDETFARIEERFSRIEAILLQHTSILKRLPEAIRKKSGLSRVALVKDRTATVKAQRNSTVKETTSGAQRDW